MVTPKSYMTTDPQEGFVLQACHGKMADGPYWQGDGEWGSFEAARIYYSRRAMKSGLKDATQSKPDDLSEIHAFGVYLP
jgi:hypothetical protein